jgi:transcriptional regulator with XRE-family HTH domain
MMYFKSQSEILQLLGVRMRDQRLAANITQMELSERAGVAYSTLRKIEATGEGSMGSYVSLLQALRLGERLEQFLTPPELHPQALHEAKGQTRQRAKRRGKAA